LNKQLENISSDFGGKLKIVAEYEDNIFKPISEERLEITTNSLERNGHAQKQHASLADRMNEFGKVVAAEEAHLQRLWKEWQETQTNFVCLAAEVLGPEDINVTFEKTDTLVATAMNAAFAAYKEAEARRSELKDDADGLEESVGMIAEDTLNMLNEQEKVRRSKQNELPRTAKFYSPFRNGKSVRRRRYRRSSRS
jgi:hypothetical protein